MLIWSIRAINNFWYLLPTAVIASSFTGALRCLRLQALLVLTMIAGATIPSHRGCPKQHSAKAELVAAGRRPLGAREDVSYATDPQPLSYCPSARCHNGVERRVRGTGEREREGKWRSGERREWRERGDKRRFGGEGWEGSLRQGGWETGEGKRKGRDGQRPCVRVDRRWRRARRRAAGPKKLPSHAVAMARLWQATLKSAARPGTGTLDLCGVRQRAD